jgi:hypothetical protein
MTLLLKTRLSPFSEGRFHFFADNSKLRSASMFHAAKMYFVGATPLLPTPLLRWKNEF